MLKDLGLLHTYLTRPDTRIGLLVTRYHSTDVINVFSP